MTGTGFVLHMKAEIYVPTVIFWFRIRASKMYDYCNNGHKHKLSSFLIFVGCNLAGKGENTST